MTAFGFSIVIVNWNTRDLLAGCLDSVVRCQVSGVRSQAGLSPVPCLLTPEVFVVDNASTDGSAAMVHEQFPWVKLIENRENVGFARANNQAIALAQGQYVMLLNPDTVVQPGALRTLIEFLATHPQIGLVGPMLLDGNGNLQPSWADFPTLRSELFTGHQRHRRPLPAGDAYEVDWLAGACLVARREVIAAVGLLDERFFLYSEETDWCLRIQRAGWRIAYYPGATVVHLEGSSTALDKPRTSFLLYHSKLLYFEKHHGRAQAQLLRLGYVLLAPIKALKAWVGGRPNTAVGHLRTARCLLDARLTPLTHG